MNEIFEIISNFLVGDVNKKNFQQQNTNTNLYIGKYEKINEKCLKIDHKQKRSFHVSNSGDLPHQYVISRTFRINLCTYKKKKAKKITEIQKKIPKIKKKLVAVNRSIK